MIEESVRVTAVDGDTAWVAAVQKQSGCSACSARSGCGTSALAKVLGQRPLQLRVLNPVGAQPGETVVIGVRDDALVRGSLAVYLVPLLVMLAGALFGELLAGQIGGGDATVASFGVVGLVIGFGWVRLFGQRAANDPRYRPVILRREDAPSTIAQPISFSTKR